MYTVGQVLARTCFRQNYSEKLIKLVANNLIEDLLFFCVLIFLLNVITETQLTTLLKEHEIVYSKCARFKTVDVVSFDPRYF